MARFTPVLAMTYGDLPSCESSRFFTRERRSDASWLAHFRPNSRALGLTGAFGFTTQSGSEGRKERFATRVGVATRRSPNCRDTDIPGLSTEVAPRYGNFVESLPSSISTISNDTTRNSPRIRLTGCPGTVQSSQRHNSPPTSNPLALFAA